MDVKLAAAIQRIPLFEGRAADSVERLGGLTNLVYRVGLDGTDYLRLTRQPSVDTNPSWSPGGRSLIFTSDRTGSPQIYRMDADGLNTVRITEENP